MVVIENIYRLRSKGVRPCRRPFSGARQVSGAIAASTLTTRVHLFAHRVYRGPHADLFQTILALTFGYALIASLIIALTVVPSMSSRMLKESKEKAHPAMDTVSSGRINGPRLGAGQKSPRHGSLSPCC